MVAVVVGSRVPRRKTLPGFDYPIHYPVYRIQVNPL